MPKKKSDLAKRLEPQVRAAGAVLSVTENGYVLSKPNERAVLHITEDTEQHEIDRYLRGAGA